MRPTIIALLLAAGSTGASSAALAQHEGHGPPAPPSTLAGWAQGAKLYDGLGTFHRKITTRSAANKGLDHAKSNVDGVRLTTWDCNGGTNQQWQIVPDQQAGVYELKNVWSGRCMDEPAGSTRSGLQMQGWTCTTGNANQRYFIKPAS